MRPQRRHFTGGLPPDTRPDVAAAEGRRVLAWADEARAIIRGARERRDHRELQVLEAWAKVAGAEAECARVEIQDPPPVPRVERNIPPAEAAKRLGIALRKLTRERFTTYRDLCIRIDGQTRGYVVSERALEARLARQRTGR